MLQNNGLGKCVDLPLEKYDANFIQQGRAQRSFLLKKKIKRKNENRKSVE